jgi:hypothetical protein
MIMKCTGKILLGLMLPVMLSGCMWRSGYYDPATGMVYGGGVDRFHHRWYKQMKHDMHHWKNKNRVQSQIAYGCGSCDLSPLHTGCNQPMSCNSCYEEVYDGCQAPAQCGYQSSHVEYMGQEGMQGSSCPHCGPGPGGGGHGVPIETYETVPPDTSPMPPAPAAKTKPIPDSNASRSVPPARVGVQDARGQKWVPSRF